MSGCGCVGCEPSHVRPDGTHDPVRVTLKCSEVTSIKLEIKGGDPFALSISSSRVPSVSILLARIMSCISLVVQVDGFQYGANKFHFKAIGMTNVSDQHWQVRRFDSVNLLSHGPAALRTYRYQSNQHGWLLDSGGLPQFMIKNSLLAFLQDAILNAFEHVRPVPVTIVLWMKGINQCQLIRPILDSLQPLDLPIVVRNLEDVGCPPARELIDIQPSESPTTIPKVLAFRDWLFSNELA